MGGREEASSFHYLYSCDLETCFRVKVGGLEGKLPRIEYEQIIENPMLKFAGRAQSSSPDLLVEAVVRGGQGDLHLPVHTAYKNMNHRWAWNQWLELPVMFSDLPSDALLCFTVFDCTGPGEREAVGGSSISVFGKKGVLRAGMMDLVVWPSTAGGADTPGKVVDSDKEQYHRLAKLTKKYHAGKIPAIDWLDRLAFAEMERIGQREKAASAKMYLNVEFPQTVDMGLPIAVVYFEAGGDRQVAAPPSSALVTLPDPEIGLENLVEAKHHRLARSARTGIYERDLKPNPEVRNRLTQVLGTPTTQPLTGEELDLIWRYRYYLAQNKKAMAKFVKCVNWSVVVEAEQAMELIRAHWAPMDVEDALELVGPNWQHPDLRRYAVGRLAQATDEDLQLYLMQLVQALKFEVASGDLAGFLIERANSNASLSNYLYWYLQIECEEGESAKPEWVTRYRAILDRFLDQSPHRATLERQHAFTDSLVAVVEAATAGRMDRTKKIDRLRELLASEGEEEGLASLSSFPPLPLPLDPSVSICGIRPDNATLFKSSLMPARLTFRTEQGGDYTAIFKTGDDMRQDQLVLQIISLMDQLLRRENLDLKLTPYRVLATSSRHGFMQCVTATAIADILKEPPAGEGSILSFFRKHNPSESGPHGVTAECMDTWVKSCAGYCVITYLLGVGDRHLDNLMLSTAGNLVHIDFGYILGRDPKPLPPPMKLSKEMIDAMGGMASEHYQEFRKECYTAFLYLRRHANLILNLFGLMVEASVPDIALEPDKAVRKVQDKFRLDLTEEEAVQFMQNLIDVSATAIMAAVVEQFHKMAQYWRK